MRERLFEIMRKYRYVSCFQELKNMFYNPATSTHYIYSDSFYKSNIFQIWNNIEPRAFNSETIYFVAVADLS